MAVARIFEEALFEDDPFEAEVVAHDARGYPIYVPSALDRVETSPSFFFANYLEAFGDVGALVERFGAERVGQSLDIVLNPSASNCFMLFDEPSVPESTRRQAILLIKNVTDLVFTLHCLPVRSHLGEPGNRLNGICYMLWDTAALPARGNWQWQAVREVMNHALRSPNIAVVEGGLHGLGHAVYQHPEAAEDIARYRRSGAATHPPLANYARWAEVGMVN